MKQFAVLCLTGLALMGCSDNDNTPAPPPATQDTSNPLVGAWQQGEQILVLEENGDLYLPADNQRQGLTWNAEENTFTFRYLDNSLLAVETITSQGKQQQDTLSLTPTADIDGEADTPLFHGDYQRANGAVGHLSGSVTLPEDSSLPEKAVLTVTLQSAEDTVIRRLIPLSEPATRYPFRLYYPDAAISSDNTYQVTSQILADGGLFFQSEPTALRLREGQFADITLPLNAVMTDSETLRGALVQQYGSTSLILCNSDRRLQLAGPQREDLIDAYQRARAYPLQPRVATVSGLLRKVPGEQEGSTQNGIIVESFTLENGQENCQLPGTTLLNTRWQLVYLGDEPVTANPDHPAPHLRLTDQQEARGNGGCNRFNGNFTHQNDQLTLGPLTATEMACPALETEQHYMDALASSHRYRLDGELLTLFDEDDQPVAGFQAIHL